jgi:competence protein ComEC
MRITFIDVGQGDAALAEMPDGMNILFDAGPRTPTFDAGERTVAPFLMRRGIGEVDLLIVSHAHSDHAGGVPAVIAHLGARRVITASPSIFRRTLGALLPPGLPARCDSAQPGELLLSTASARVYLLYPFSGVCSGGGGDNESLVVKLQYGAISFLLTGDAGQAEEDALLAAHGAFLRSTVLKAAHHGSQTSSSGRFLDAVRPEHAVISVGKYNRFGHPSPAVVERYRTAGASVSRTDEEGAVMFETDGSTVHKVEWR